MLLGLPLLAVVLFATTFAGYGALSARADTVLRAGLPEDAGAEDASSEQLVPAINDFGVALLGAMMPREVTKNAVISPTSVHAALSMTAAGADGDTATQMRRVLRTDDIQNVDAQWAGLLSRIDRRGAKQKFEIANALWGRKGMSFKRSFVDTDRSYYGAQLSMLDFESERAPAAINEWVEANTGGAIKNMVGRIPEDAILYLTNAVYFKGEWVEPFDAISTQKTRFTRSDGSAVDVDMMNQERSLRYAESPVLKATRLPYRGVSTAYYIFLPHEGVPVDLALESLAASGFAEIRRSMMTNEPTEVVVGLPKVDTGTSEDLVSPLKNMGMPAAFDPRRADFTRIADTSEPIFIGGVKHNTELRVDEMGTVAAAATVVEIGAGGGPPIDPPRVVCDRPYLFAIVDETSASILFLGVVNDPTR